METDIASGDVVPVGTDVVDQVLEYLSFLSVGHHARCQGHRIGGLASAVVLTCFRMEHFGIERIFYRLCLFNKALGISRLI